MARLNSVLLRALQGRAAIPSIGSAHCGVSQSSEISGIPPATPRHWLTMGLVKAFVGRAGSARTKSLLTVADLVILTALRRLRTAGFSMKRASAIVRTLGAD